MQENLSLYASMYPIPPSHKVKTRDGRMMADLFGIDGTPIDHPLVGFSKDRVEGFLYVKVH